MVAIVVGLFVCLLATYIVLQMSMKLDWKAVKLASEWKLKQDLFPLFKEKYRGMMCLADSPY